MHVLQRGDRLVVSELSRLGRSLGQIVAILDALAKAGVAFVAMKENIRIEGQRDIQTKVMTTLFALFAEVERDLISERTREGLAKARASGQKARAPERLVGRLTAQRQGGRHPALPRAGRFQDRHRQAHGRVPYDPLQLHEHPRAQAEPLESGWSPAVARTPLFPAGHVITDNQLVQSLRYEALQFSLMAGFDRIRCDRTGLIRALGTKALPGWSLAECRRV